MNVKAAHAVLVLFDFAAVAACYWSLSDYLSVQQALHLGSSSVSFESSLLYLPFAMVIPVLHVTSLLRFWEPVKQSATYVSAASVFVLIVVVAVFKLQATNEIENQLKAHQYHACETIQKGRYRRVIYRKGECY